jgi:subtilisin family serine protease
MPSRIIEAMLFITIALIISIVLSPLFDVQGRDENFEGMRIQIRGASKGKRYIPGIVIVKFKSELRRYLRKSYVGVDEFNRVASQLGMLSIERMFPNHRAELGKGIVDLSLIYIARFPENMDMLMIARKLSRLRGIEYAEPHYIYEPHFIPNDTLLYRQWYIYKVKLPEAWDITRGDTNIVIGIIDTGVDLDHPDLAGNLWRNWDEIPGNGIDDDGNGYVDDFIGWDFGGKDNFNNDPSKQDNNPSEKRKPGKIHGTHVAGIASAVTNNGLGIAGAGFKCRIMAVKVAVDDDPNNFIYYGYQGIVYAVDNGAKIINCSWGGSGGSSFEQDIINYATQKGALVVAAAGNNRSDEFHSPSGYKHVLSVAAVDANDRKTSYSNYGETVDVTAPGGEFAIDGGIFSTYLDDTYKSLSGTSMASPLVAGIAALVRARYPNLTPDQVAEKIRVTAKPIDDLNQGYRYQLGYGRVDAYRALTVSSPAIRFEDYVIDDSLSNGDMAFDPGEIIQVRGIFRNYLERASNISIQLTTDDPYVTILNGSFNIASLGQGESKDNFETPFKFKINPDAPENHTVRFVIKISSGSYNDFVTFKILVRPTFRDHNANYITLTITSRGNLAYNDYPNNRQGRGLRYKGGNDMLFEGAFLAGVDSIALVDVARDETGRKQERDFASRTPFLLKSPGDISAQDGHSVFTDSIAPRQNMIGVEVILNSFAFNRTPDDMNFVILKYTIINTSRRDFINFRAGLFLDFDLGSVTENIIKYDAENKLVYVYDIDPEGERALAGISFLGRSGSFGMDDEDISVWFINNAGGDGYWGIYDGFTKVEKWEALSYKGVARDSAGAGDISVVIGTGSSLLEGGDTLVIGFAIICGDSLEVMRRAVAQARIRWNEILTSPSPIEKIVKNYQLYQNYPNPFNIETFIKFAVPETQFVQIDIYDLMGRKVEALVSERKLPGRYVIKFNADGLSSGVYFYTLKAGKYIITRKMLLIK